MAFDGEGSGDGMGVINSWFEGSCECDHRIVGGLCVYVMTIV